MKVGNWLLVFCCLTCASVAVGQDPPESSVAPAEVQPASESTEAVVEEKADGVTEVVGSEDKASAEPKETQADTGDAVETAQDAAEAEPAIKPRLQLKLDSFVRLRAAIDRSPLAPLVRHFSRVISESYQRNPEGIDHEQLVTMLQVASEWPETEAECAIFAPDREGNARWGVRLKLPVGQVHDLVNDMMSDERLEGFFDGAELQTREASFVLTLGDKEVVFLRAEGTGHSVLSSHTQLPLPNKFFAGTEGESKPLLAASLSFDSTEKDSGETFFSKLSLIQSVDYTLRSQQDGNWMGEFRVNWPPMLGLAAKPFVGRTKQTFFVPQEAFAGGVAKVNGTSVALDRIVGFEEGDTLLQPHANDDLCVSVLPGTGFLPVPDIVLQCRVSDVTEMMDSVRKHTRKLNKKSEEEDETEIWYDANIRGHDVFWSKQVIDAQTILPATLRPVFFVQKAKDAKDREREFLVIGLTSTDPQDFVRRWLDLPRGDAPRFLPGGSGLNSEVWLNWKEIYTWVLPYVNMGLSGTSSDFVIQDAASERIQDGRMTVRVKYEGLRVAFDGPMPLGLSGLPAMISASMQESTKSDLGRERLAVRRLRVLYHHCQLFHQDIGRWPSEVAELDGYIDFAGNSHLLKLRGSPKKQWNEFFAGLFDGEDEDDDEDEEDDEDDLYAEIDDSLYVVSWDDDDHWMLGFEEDKFDHLEKLYIDEMGNIHRVEKVKADKEDAKNEAEGKDAETAEESVVSQTE